MLPASAMGPQRKLAKLILLNDHAHAVAASQSVVFIVVSFSFNYTTLDWAAFRQLEEVQTCRTRCLEQLFPSACTKVFSMHILLVFHVLSVYYVLSFPRFDL